MGYPESNEQFNRQQGEELIAALTGEEAPDLGYPATNEQFNREQGNRLIEAVKNFSPSGGGLPDPTSLTDGTAMVAVDGEWKMQEGYGYTGEPAFEPITWDGETEGRDALTITGVIVAYKVSDNVFTAEQLVGCSFDLEYEGTVFPGTIKSSMITENDSLIHVIIPNEVGASLYVVKAVGDAPSTGLYFVDLQEPGVTYTLSPPSTVHPFDQALIPGVVPSGGSAGNVLKKTSNGIAWEDVNEVPSGGSVGNVLKKTSNGVEWENVNEVPAAPSEDGAYVLTCTITDGEAVYSWETNA